MSDESAAADTTPADGNRVRQAADALVAALQAHLAAVEARAGEQDPAVQRAYVQLRSAAIEYDDALFDAYREVTPFDFAVPEEGGTYEVAPDAEADETRMSVLSRSDFSVDDPSLLFERVRTEGATLLQPGEVVDDEAAALGLLVDVLGVDEIAHGAEAYGLRWHGTTTWVLRVPPEERAAVAAEWMDDPFWYADADDVLFRFDLSPV
jgi:hypothetical protein